MVLDASRPSISTATLAAAPAGVTSADPWDAPYFGGPVYFGYTDTAVKDFAPATIETAVRDGSEDAAIAAEMETSGTDGGEDAVAAVPGEAGVGAQGGDGGKRRGWLARLFKGELYIGGRG